ncbi:MAG: hypothetical protein ACOC4J_01245 [Bacteroidota bacterium]
MKYIKHTPTRKDIKIWVSLFLFIVIIPLFVAIYSEGKNQVFLITSIIIIGFFILNLVLRKSLSLKKYYTHPFNPLTSKVCYEKTYDIPKKLMFEKIIEVLKYSEFELVETNKDRFEILAITKISLKSWGENIYIDLDANGNETIMKFCSVTIFQIYDWGKSEKNYKDLCEQIESSLTI